VKRFRRQIHSLTSQPIFRTSGQLDLGLDTLFFQTQFGQIRRLGQ